MKSCLLAQRERAGHKDSHLHYFKSDTKAFPYPGHPALNQPDGGQKLA